jgi:hypothetical protein
MQESAQVSQLIDGALPDVDRGYGFDGATRLEGGQ